MYRLLAKPEYVEPLREEVDAVIKEEGWTKAGVDKMYKIDSLLRETQRLDGQSPSPLDPFSTPKTRYWYTRPFFLVGMGRFVLRPLKLSDGMTLPAGTLIAVPASATHKDEIYHTNPEEFDGFRFAKLREEEGDPMTNRYQAVSTSNEHLPFWTGPTRMVGVSARSL